MSSVDDAIYDTLVQMCKGISLPPKSERTKVQKAAVIRFWRGHGKYYVKVENSKDCLYFEGKKVIRKSELKDIVAKEYNRCKGSGARKIHHTLKDIYHGLSEQAIQTLLNQDKAHNQRNTRFRNKAVLRPIRAKDVQIRHQIDLIDMGRKGTVTFRSERYRYILTVEDVFSRFVWLRPLKKKSSLRVYNELKNIYREHGPPLVLQCDQGTEFKGAVKRLEKDFKIKIIRSRPYHPQSQGKVERGHRTFHQKTNYDLMKLVGKAGLNWVKELPEYQKVLNDDPKEVLGYLTPFQVYYGRKSNFLQKTRIERGKEIFTDINGCLPRSKDRKARKKNVSDIKKVAASSTERCNNRMVRRHLQKNPPSIYDIGEKVLIRKPGKRSTNKRCAIIEGIVMKRNLKRHYYKVSWSNDNNRRITTWIPVNDITSITREKELEKTKLAKERQRKSTHRKKYHIELDHSEVFEVFEDQGFQIEYNPDGNGNCQFSALAHQLKSIGIFRSDKTLRKTITDYLRENPLDNDGFPLMAYVYDFDNWNDYVDNMASDGTFGDQQTLLAAANLFNINIVIISTLGPGGTHVISSNVGSPVATVYLGHFAEDHGIHYVSLRCSNRGDCNQNTPNIRGSESDESEGEVVEPVEHSRYDSNQNTASNQESESAEEREVVEQEEPSSHFQNARSNQGSESDQEKEGFKQEIPSMHTNENQPRDRGSKSAAEDIEHTHDTVAGQTMSDVLNEDRQLLNFDILEQIIRLTVELYPFSRQALRAVNSFFKECVDKIPPPKVYIPELEQVTSTHSMRKLLQLKGKNSGAVIHLRDVINSRRWIHAWLLLKAIGLGWFVVSHIFWKK